MQQKDALFFLKEKIEKISKTPFSVMEVCGTHTMSIAQHAIASFLPKHVRLLSGPGCPVCVTTTSELELALNLAQKENVIICTFGDMLRIPSSNFDSLIHYKNVKVCYGPLEALEHAQKNPEKEIIFLGIGFETTTPLIAQTILEASFLKLKNFSVLPLFKTVPRALDMILDDKDIKIDAFLLPGHVSAITGFRYWDFLKDKNVLGGVSGFEPLLILETLYLLILKFEEGKKEIFNHYKEVVTDEGNVKACEVVGRIFKPADAFWRELGKIPLSGLDFRDEFKHFSAYEKFHLKLLPSKKIEGCLCGKILMGKKTPKDCSHFKKTCTPSHPIGPCIISSEGTCSAWYKYE